MSQRLPKPMLDALARESAPAEHPSPDVLAAFVERTLPDGENRSVTSHLAHCGECREVVFLASGASEHGASEQKVAPGAQARPRWRWMPHLAWALPLVSVMLLVGGYFERHRETTTVVGPELASKAASEAPIRPTEQSQSAASAPAAPVVVAPAPAGSAGRPASTQRLTAKPATTTTSVKKAAPENLGVVAMNAAAPPVEDRSLRAKAETPAPLRGRPVNATNGALGGVAPSPKASGFAPSAGESEAVRQFGAADSLNLSVNRAVTGAARVAHPGWRITAQGQLEHLTSDGWTSVFPGQAIVFRTVSVMGEQVCAGGDGGALFQSDDRGAHWKRVTLGSPGDAETSAIVSIRFDDPQHGVVATASGSSYRTSDGGVTWTKQ